MSRRHGNLDTAMTATRTCFDCHPMHVHSFFGTLSVTESMAENVEELEPGVKRLLPCKTAANPFSHILRQVGRTSCHLWWLSNIWSISQALCKYKWVWGKTRLIIPIYIPFLPAGIQWYSEFLSHVSLFPFPPRNMVISAMHNGVSLEYKNP